MKRIESRNNPLVVRVGKLSSRKHREEENLFFFEGAHLLEEYLRFGNCPHTVFVTESALIKYEKLLSGLSQELICSVPDFVFEKLSTEQAPQGILTVAPYLKQVQEVENISQVPGQILLLESVRDNGNVGTVLRTAAALGWSVVLSADCADLYAPKTVRATMGALFSRNTYLCKDPVSFVKSACGTGRRTYAAALGEKSCLLGQFTVGKEDLFVIGNEGQGISAPLLEACDSGVLIPMTDGAESLNASIAAAVIMWEGVRSRA
jgi:TrmH family RNA methyltransferase